MLCGKSMRIWNKDYGGVKVERKYKERKDAI